MSLLNARQITLSFDGKSLFQNLSFTVDYGQKVAIIGQSGSGKSSLLRLMLGFIQPVEGSVIYSKGLKGPEAVASFRKESGYLPQDLTYPFVKVSELLEFFGEIGGEIKQAKLGSFMKQLRLEDNTLGKRLQSLSGGQKQRLMIALLAAMERKVLMLDEPSSALDEDNGALAMQLLLKELPCAVIFTTHNPKWADQADKIISL